MDTSKLFELTKTDRTFTFLDIACLTTALIFILLVLRVKANHAVETSAIGKALIVLPLSIWLVLFTLQFKALRKISIFISWTAIALVLLMIRFWLRDDALLIYIDKSGETSHYTQGLLIPLLALAFYQICRQISLKYYNVELSIPGKLTNMNYEQNRKANWLERLHSIGFVAIPVLVFCW